MPPPLPSCPFPSCTPLPQDSSAMAFTRAFYLALLSGQTVRASFAIAREALKASPCIADR